MKEHRDALESIGSNLYTPMLGIWDDKFSRSVTDGLWTILQRAQMMATIDRERLVENGKKLTLPMKGTINPRKEVTFVIYHVPFDQNKDKRICSFDVPIIDHSKVNHLELLKWSVENIRQTCPEAEIIICTDEEFGERMKDLNISILRPRVDRNRPMYYRARTYNTIIQNRWLGGTVIFMDSDAIVLKNPGNLPKLLNFKVGLTARYSPNLMPINEGVIIVDSRSEQCIEFFAHYMGTYEEIKEDEIIKSIARNDLMRWRGGQLSLNAVCSGCKMIDFRDSTNDIKILPCSKFNRAVKSKEEVNNLSRNQEVYVAHLKGKAKLSK